MPKKFELFESGKKAYYIDIDTGGNNPAYMLIKIPISKIQNGSGSEGANLAFKIATKWWHNLFNNGKPVDKDYFLLISRVRDAIDNYAYDEHFSTYKEYFEFISNTKIEDIDTRDTWLRIKGCWKNALDLKADELKDGSKNGTDTRVV